jgi:hypothetical protein
MISKISTLLMIGASIMLTSSLVFANPSMLPNHPGYPMGAAKDPVTGQSVANDPGQPVPTREEALRQAASFHDAHSTTPSKEIRGSIVPPQQEGSQDINAADKTQQ